MKRLLASLALITVTAILSGCYYDPGYSYVRSSGYNGDVYYGQSAPVYNGGYYNGYYGAPGYYDSYGCCYAPGVSVWYGGGSHYRRGGYGRGYYRGSGYHGNGGHWQGRPSSGGRPHGGGAVHQGGGSHGGGHAGGSHGGGSHGGGHRGNGGNHHR